MHHPPPQLGSITLFAINLVITLRIIHDPQCDVAPHNPPHNHFELPFPLICDEMPCAASALALTHTSDLTGILSHAKRPRASCADDDDHCKRGWCRAQSHFLSAQASYRLFLDRTRSPRGSLHWLYWAGQTPFNIIFRVLIASSRSKCLSSAISWSDGRGHL